MDRYFKFTAPEQGTLKVTSSNTGSSAAMDRTVAVTVGEDSQAQAGGFGKATPGELEFSIPAGDVYIMAPENGLCFYKVEFTYTTGGKKVIEYDWDFASSDWQDALGALGGVNTDITNIDITVETSSNTGSSAAMDRTVAVTVGEDSQAQADGFGKATPGELEFSIPAGEVVITAPENGLCFYHIYYTNQ